MKAEEQTKQLQSNPPKIKRTKASCDEHFTLSYPLCLGPRYCRPTKPMTRKISRRCRFYLPSSNKVDAHRTSRIIGACRATHRVEVRILHSIHDTLSRQHPGLLVWPPLGSSHYISTVFPSERRKGVTTAAERTHRPNKPDKKKETTRKREKTPRKS